MEKSLETWNVNWKQDIFIAKAGLEKKIVFMEFRALFRANLLLTFWIILFNT